MKYITEKLTSMEIAEALYSEIKKFDNPVPVDRNKVVTILNLLAGYRYPKVPFEFAKQELRDFIYQLYGNIPEEYLLIPTLCKEVGAVDTVFTQMGLLEWVGDIGPDPETGWDIYRPTDEMNSIVELWKRDPIGLVEVDEATAKEIEDSAELKRNMRSLQRVLG